MFDIIVHTDGPEQIQLLLHDNEGRLIGTEKIPVPIIEPIDTCGAGDTFTATLAAYLLKTQPQGLQETWNMVLEAMPLCIKTAQEVCMKKYTAITSEKI